MDSRRPGRPYVWVSWITGVLAGIDQCIYKPWYKSHYRYAKKVDPTDDGSTLREWTRNHDEMTAARVLALKAAGYDVFVEDQNKFTLEGRTVTVSGKPDIVAVDHIQKLVKIVDEKSGKKKASDWYQVFIYLLAMPITVFKGLADKGYKFVGEVEYRSGPEMEQQLGAADHSKIIKMIQKMGSDVPPPRVPSASECKFCDIASCPDRFKEPENSSVTTDQF